MNSKDLLLTLLNNDNGSGKDFFYRDNFTTENNSLLSELKSILINATDVGFNSKAVQRLQADHEEGYKQFYNSLSEEQCELYESYSSLITEENVMIESERFIFGFKLAVKLLTESLY